MFYEEKVIQGVLCWRGTPKGDWIEKTPKQLTEQIAALEAKIDALMLEYCPDEMTQEQIANWEAHQKAAPEDCQDER